MYLSHPTLMVTAYHITVCFCLTVSTLVSNECFCTKAVVLCAAEGAPAWLRSFSLSPFSLQFMEISLLLHCGQVALTLCLFPGAEEEGEMLLSTALQHGNCCKLGAEGLVHGRKHSAGQGKPFPHETTCSRVLNPLPQQFISTTSVICNSPLYLETFFVYSFCCSCSFAEFPPWVVQLFCFNWFSNLSSQKAQYLSLANQEGRTSWLC